MTIQKTYLHRYLGQLQELSGARTNQIPRILRAVGYVSKFTYEINHISEVLSILRTVNITNDAVEIRKQQAAETFKEARDRQHTHITHMHNKK